ncbi:MAG: HD domain-containing protein [Nitrospiraceae bacterium]|nr:HD domain-containing protein [Nitrospiraceae bacterium]
MSDDAVLRKNRQLKTLVDLSALVNSTLDTREIRKRAIEAATTLADAETGSLLLVDRETGDLFFEVALGEKGNILQAMRLARGQGIAGWVAERGEPLIVNDAGTDPRFFRGADEKSSFTTKNMVCVPLKSKGKVIGVLQAVNKRSGLFDEEDSEGLSALANQIAVAIENAGLYQELKEAFYGTAHALAETIEKRDPYTGGHTYRVMEYSLAIGKMMDLPDEETENLKLAAILHDIGKIGIRDSILLKNGRLDREEVRTMNLHAEYGAEILRHVKQLDKVIPGVRAHHERFDGNGYPDRLKGSGIPMIARIIAVADTFDAMTTDRPYRKALTVSEAVGELRKNSGTQFDGEIVETFVRYFSGTGQYAA